MRAVHESVARDEVTGEVRLPVPVEEWNAYSLPMKAAEAERVTVHQIVLMFKSSQKAQLAKRQRTVDSLSVATLAETLRKRPPCLHPRLESQFASDSIASRDPDLPS